MARRSPTARVLVTGGSGFIGSHLCERLLADGHEVLCVDNFYTGRRQNIEHLLPNTRFEVMRHDITHPLYVEVDEIFNLACPASPIHYQFDPVQTLKTSVHGSINVLGLAKRIKAKIFQASTSEVYGDPALHPQPESYWGNVNPLGIRACYDEGKRAAETLFFDYHRQHGVRIKVARIFNTYGPRMHPKDGRVVSNFIVQALKGKPITIYGDGSQSRSFCYIDDLVEAIMRLMSTDDGIIGPINLGNPFEFTIRQLAELVVELTASKSELVFKPLPQDDPKQRCPDIATARSALQWEPKVKLLDGLKDTVSFFVRLSEPQEKTMRLSIVVPVYNEVETLGPVLVLLSRALPEVDKEIIVVDDCSKDGTREWLKINFPEGTRAGANMSLGVERNLTFEEGSGVSVRPLYHERNKGKGGGLQTGFSAVTGDVVVIQDADLEYDPNDWTAMYDLIAVRKVADVVYGSRFYGRPHRSLYYHHYLANRLISVMFNVLFNQTLSDIETCYKMMTREVLSSLRLSANDFGIEIEISAGIARYRKWRIYELGISYYGRTYVEGKKINWRDGLKALWYIVKYRMAG